MEKSNTIPSVCIVGRPNVGKSSLFNCILGERRAVVVGESGTTRDRVEAVIRIKRYSFKIVDTGGFVAEEKDALSGLVKEQIYQAVEEASVIILVTDVQAGLCPADREVTEIIRKYSKPAILVANKADNQSLEDEAVEFFQLGIGEPVAVSCVHRRGLDTLRERIIESATELLEGHDEGERCLKIAVVGRPNVGKSSFVNNLLKKERVIVSDTPGTTRDSIDTFFTYNGDKFMLIDTAGIRHKRKIKTVVDTFSVMRSKESIKRADVAVLLLDAKDGVTKDDVSILDFIEESGKGCVVLVNKWDLAEDVGKVTMEEYEKHLVYASSRLRNYPISFISAKSGRNVLDSLKIVKVVDANLDIKVTTPFLNKMLERHDPSRIPISKNKTRPNFLYITQTSSRPVVFTVFVNHPERVLTAHFSYIENVLRDNLPLSGIPVKIDVRKSLKNK